VVLRRFALASLVANVVIVVTGGVVRLTGSGLGCPTWPQCAPGSLVVRPEMGVHGVIEFTNRTLFGVLAVLAAAALASALCQQPRRRRDVVLAAVVLGGIPAQAVLGGITVLTGLNPWVVACHFLLSMALIAAAYGLWAGPATGKPPAFARTVAAVAVAVLAAGTVVTGSGPHAGDATAPRTGLDPGQVAQFHADLVFLLLGLSVGLWFATRARAAAILVGVELGQGVVGFVQYFTHLPELVVGLHMAGACLVWLATLNALRAGAPQPAAPRSPRQSVPLRPDRTPDTATAR
jgi:cytochrome c oxidase assembly protein subunit 15